MTEKPQVPIIIVAALIVDPEQNVLLGRHVEGSLRGKWVLPGGAVLFGERVVDALVRVLRLKAGIDPDDLDLGRWADEPHDIIDAEGREHRVMLLREAGLHLGKLDVSAGGDLDQVAWFDFEGISELIAKDALTPTIRKVLDDYGLTR